MAHKIPYKINIDREAIWLITFISLFSALMAFFILSMTLIDLEGSSVRRSYQKFQHELYLKAKTQKERMNLTWLEVEESVTKGTRLTLKTDKINQEEIFRLGSDKLSPAWQSAMTDLVILIEQLHLNDLEKHYAQHINVIKLNGLELKVQILIEGHTDEQPMNSAKFPSNWELSTARALQVQQVLQANTKLQPTYFAIAGLGSFRPYRDIKDYANNRRVEIYINTEMIKKDT